ncbi:MAG: hypothetical protein WED10_06365 [Brumimicrobium sp.]
MIENYISQIKSIKNEHSAFDYKTSVWSKLNQELKKEVKDFENKSISRSQVLKAYKDYFNTNGNIIRPFLLTMIWGFSDNGYGTYRTNKYLTNPENHKLIKTAFEAVNNEEIEKAFKALKKIEGLGISYISKILYFAGRAKGIKNYPLIYDIRVARSLLLLSTPKEVVELVEVYPSSKFKDYNKFNEMIHGWAKKYNLKAECIEIFLFDQKFELVESI